MKLVKHGPDVPDRLIQAQEDGNVVFFCGAGISYPAGLPDFKGLVDELYVKLGETPNPEESTAYDEKRFDAVIGLLERRVANRDWVRGFIADILQPDFTRKGATDTHQALLLLARCKDGALRLVTTNFDRIFTHVDPGLHHIEAPRLPVPKRSRWNGIVYLHGLLPEKKDPQQFNHLVVSSGDFGLAYLTERWASRFVTELFRGYTVCFVGYSINDPVMRYMVDALSADRMMGEATQEVFAFGSFVSGKQDVADREWRSKGVTPILYHEKKGKGAHSLLHRTLQEWARISRDGLSGKCAIITREAGAGPSKVKDDGQIERVLWALCAPSGKPAQTFADLDPVPPIEWLEVFEEVRYGPPDLSRFGIVPFPGNNDNARFSLMDRRSPYELAPWMSPVGRGGGGYWDEVMGHLARWLARHLDKPEVMAWVLRRGACLHPRFLDLIRREMAKSTLGGPLAAIWRLFLAGRVASTGGMSFLFHDWISQFKTDGWTPSLRMKFVELLQPMVRLREPTRWQADPESESTEKPEPRIRDYVDWEIVLRAGEHVRHSLKECTKNPGWQAGLVELLPDLTRLLRDAIALMEELGEADEKHDRSYSEQPSISDHPQNADYYEWTVLIMFCRDAWLAAAEQSPERAGLEFARWGQIPYPLFRRLRFFAAANSAIVSVNEGLELLLSDDAWWLWTPETQREAFRLLVFLAPRLADDDARTLYETILSGPPRQMYRGDIESDRLQRVIEREIWLRLEKCRVAGASLPENAESERQRIAALHPEWKIAPNDRDEFPVWTGSGDEWRKRTILPKPLDELVQALLDRPESNVWYEDDWRERCRDDSAQAIEALMSLAKMNKWPKDVWREALQAFADEKLFLDAWKQLSPFFEEAPLAFVGEIRHTLSHWLQVASKRVEFDDRMFVVLVDRILDGAVSETVTTDDDPVSRAINHPVGQATEALINLWYRTKPAAGGGYPPWLKDRLDRLVDRQVPVFRHGRVILGAHVTALFQVDEGWTRTNLLTFFDWGKDKNEARGVWKGFLWSPRLYESLIAEMKRVFLETTEHYEDLGKHDSQYASLLTLAALEARDLFSTKELKDAFSKLPVKGLAAAARMIHSALGGAGEKRAEYWTNRVKPFIESTWPKSMTYRSPDVSVSLARVCVAAGDRFVDAVDTVYALLVPSENHNLLVDELRRPDFCQRYPETALKLLGAVVDVSQRWVAEELKGCLEEIGQQAPKLRSNAVFRQLDEYIKKHERG